MTDPSADDKRLADLAAGHVAFKAWWRELTLRCDPIHKPNLTSDAFTAGYQAGLDASRARLAEVERERDFAKANHGAANKMLTQQIEMGESLAERMEAAEEHETALAAALTRLINQVESWTTQDKLLEVANIAREALARPP